MVIKVHFLLQVQIKLRRGNFFTIFDQSKSICLHIYSNKLFSRKWIHLVFYTDELSPLYIFSKEF